MKARHPLRRRLFLMLALQSDPQNRAAQWFSWVLTLMVLSSVAAVIAESVPEVQTRYGSILSLFDALSIVFFSTEYLLRIWTAVEKSHPTPRTSRHRRWAYVLSFHGLIDLLAVLPFFLQSLVPGLDLRFLRVIRIMRILKLSHYSTALEDLIAAIYAEKDAFISALYLLALSILLTSCLMHFAEHHLQPDKFGTIPDAMWWSIITITTVGYGDAVPMSGWGKVIGACTALSGVFTVALLTGIVASAFATRVRTHELEFTTEVEEVLKDGHLDAQEQRNIEHLRRTFNITEDHAQAIVRQIIEEQRLYNKPE